MKILCLFTVKDDADLGAIEGLLMAEERFAWDMYRKDLLREHYESDMPTPAISILEMESIEAARDYLEELPINKAGFLDCHLYPLRPFGNWETLFKDENKTS